MSTGLQLSPTSVDFSVSSNCSGRMWLVAAVVLLLSWLSTGIYMVRGNQVAVVRVCGQAQRLADGSVAVKPSGLYIHLPWPFVAIDLVNLNEVRTVTVGGLESDGINSGEFLRSLDPARQSQFLSGDKNVLHATVNVQYRISRLGLDHWLYGSSAAEERLQVLAGAVLADVILRSGVDFVHTLGHNEIRQLILARLRAASERQNLGVEIDDVALAGVAPPLRVKAEFVDVMNARADRETYINRARAYAEQRLADATATARKTQDESQTYRHQTIESARAAADSFTKLVEQCEQTASDGVLTYAQSRQLTLRRRYLETLEDIYRKVAGNIMLDSGKPVDLTMPRTPSSR